MNWARSILISMAAFFFVAVGYAAAPAPAADKGTNHWAYQPLMFPALPVVANPAWVRTPIDAFILRALEARGLAPSPEAGKRTLLRRLYFDLIGLPPTPEEMQRFLEDNSSEAYRRVVDRLLASPRYGERWARHWMDTVHFAETHGHDQDRIRTNAWPYRDYLIASFNQDKPYARFLEEQVAGDVLFPETPQATVALGFLAAGPWDESSLRDIREDTLDRQIARYLDRDDIVTTVMQTFASTTVQCARCHDHKFDPIPQRDYYALQAVFAGVDRANRAYDTDPDVARRRREWRRLRQRVEAGDRELLLDETTRREVADWERLLAERKVDWKIIRPQSFLSAGGATLTPQPDGSILAGGPRPDRDTYTFSAPSPIPTLTAVRLEVMIDDSLPHRGPGRQDNGNLHLNEFELRLRKAGAPDAIEIPLGRAEADFDQNGWTIQHALDRDEKTAWGIYPRVGETHEAVFELKEPLELSAGEELVFVLKQLHGQGHLIGRPRLSVTSARPPVTLSRWPAEVREILAVPDSERTEAQRLALAPFYWKDKIARELAALPKPSLVYAAAADFEPDGGLKPAGHPRAVHVLQRGEISKPLELASPGALSCVRALPARFEVKETDAEGTRRAALARWLASPDNPLTWRSIVNRVWQHHFGRGLVDTPNDFGRMGSAPSHPELLDWLALWFRDQAHGSLKELHRLIVTSAVYRQDSDSEPAWPSSSQAGPAGARIDSGNRLLWRMNRVRLEAEQVRDAVLQISGQLDLRLGGPSDKQFDLQPGIHVTPRVDYTRFDVDQAAGRRRGVYRFLFRTLPDPFMDALDCPAGDQLTPVRNASVTVQQAFALWNNAFVVRQAEHFGERLERERTGTDAQVERAFALVLNRPPTPGETKEFAAYARRYGLASLGRLLFNSNEFIFVN
jgi:Protein of unknown function (DUF1549)/Protein of unknown function (DUF1553)